MGEFLRKYVSRRLLALGEGDIAALMTAMRQLGVGSRGGAEALVIFHQPICDEWASGSLNTPLARNKVDEQNCFGMIEWNAARKAAGHFLPKHAAAAEWKHRTLSNVEQQGLPPMPKDRCADQGAARTIHDMLHKKLEAWQTSGTMMMLTSSAIRSWCRPICKHLMWPTTMWEQSEIRRRQTSSATSQTWTQPHLSGKSMRCHCWPGPADRICSPT